MISVGIDIVSIARIKKIIDETVPLENRGVLNSVFTENEIEYCSSRKNSYQHYAVRFAGKEAFLKALGTGLIKDIVLSDIEFLNNEAGAPYANCKGSVQNELLERNIKNVSVSFSHSRTNAIAIVILEK